MVSVSFLATLLVCVSLLMLGGFIATGSGKSRARRSFAVLCVALAGWVAANGLADSDPVRSLFWTRLTFEAVVVAAAAFLAFVWNFPHEVPLSIPRQMLFWPATAVMGAVAWLPLFIPSVEFSGGTSNVVTGPLYILFLIYFVVFVGGAVVLLVRKFRAERGVARDRLRLILAGVLIMAIISSMTNLLLPLVTGTNPLARYGTYSALLFAGIITYAIVRQQLFSVRLVAARTLTYTLTLGTLAVWFALASFFLVDRFLGGNSSAGQRAAYIGFLLIAALAYQPLRAFFDIVTRRVFFQDLYDVKFVLNQLGDIASRSVSSKLLLAKSMDVLGDVLHPVFLAAYTKAPGENAMRLATYTGKRPKGLDDLVLSRLPHHAVLVAEELAQGGQGLPLEALDNHGVAVVLSLKPTGQDVGYILCGYKLNGTSYHKQDLAMLETASDGLGVAVQNTLRFEEISHFNETLQGQIREATGELRASNKKLKSLDEAKDEFISMASHQLRTPLTSVKGYLSMVLEGDAGTLNQTQRQLLEQAFGSSQRMVYLISDFLNVSRLQTGKFTIERTPVVLSQVVQQEAKQLETAAQDRNITLQCSVPSNFPTLQLDEGKLRQAIMNFIDNAIFYSRPGGVIHIDLVRTAKEVALTVQDDGIGVPASERHHLFTKFYRASNARTARPDGTGIGLFMAKKVIVAHGGSVIFSSTEGKGSTFGFRLPLHQPTGLEDHSKELG